MKFPSPNSKYGRVLAALMTGESYNLFEAESQLHDRSLHSTVSALQNTYGIQVSRCRETVPGYEGRPTGCCRYWIDVSERLRIRYEQYLKKEKALTRSDETIGKGLDISNSNDNAGGNDEQVSLLTMPVKFVKNYFKTIARF